VEKTNIKVIQKKERPRSTSYPEYHRLFAGGTSENPKRVSIFYYVNKLRSN